MSSSKGIVYLVGGGPGAPDLITVRGRRCLRRAEVALYDDLSGRSLLEELSPGAEPVYVGKRQGRSAMSQQEICELLVHHARQGKRVVRLKGGDPFVFGRGGEEALALARAQISFEVVPGVSTAVAVPAFAGIPVTHRGLCDGYEVFTGHKEPAQPPTTTAVMLMGMRRLAANVELLLARGYAGDTPAAVIQWGTLARQKTVVATLERIAEAAAELGSPGVLVVGQVVTLRRQLSWFERRPLFGKRVLVTRARHQAAQTCELLQDQGAEPVTLPTIAINPPDDAEPLRAAARELGSYHYSIFTSANTVDALAAAMEQQGLDSRALAGQTICAIGPGTAKALGRLGLRPDLVPQDHRAEGILELLTEQRVAGKRVLLPRAAVARQILPETLRQRGARLDLVTAYVTGLPPAEQTAAGLARLRAGEVDVITFTSASTAQNFGALLGQDLQRLCQGKIVVAIGPITADACRDVGLEVEIMPPRYTLPAMVQAMVEHFARQR